MQRNESQQVLAASVMNLIDQGHRRISARLDLTRVQILGLISTAGPMRPATIAERLQLTKSTVSRHLTGLQEAGQIRIRADPADARTFLAETTPEGEQDIKATAAIGAAQFARAISHWSDAEVDEARRVVQRMLDAWAPADAPDRLPPPSDALAPNGPHWMRRRVPEHPAEPKEQK